MGECGEKGPAGVCVRERGGKGEMYHGLCVERCGLLVGHNNFSGAKKFLKIMLALLNCCTRISFCFLSFSQGLVVVVSQYGEESLRMSFIHL